MKRAVFDEQGFPTAFYAPEVHGEDIPPEAVEISDGQWLEFITNAGMRRWRDGQVEIYAPPAPEPQPPRSVAMWRARTIMKVTPRGDGTLFDAVQAAIAALTDPLQKASAEEALERGDVFDRDGVFVPMLAYGLGITEKQLDELMEQAAALPA